MPSVFKLQLAGSLARENVVPEETAENFETCSYITQGMLMVNGISQAKAERALLMAFSSGLAWTFVMFASLQLLFSLHHYNTAQAHPTDASNYL